MKKIIFRPTLRPELSTLNGSPDLTTLAHITDGSVSFTCLVEIRQNVQLRRDSCIFLKSNYHLKLVSFEIYLSVCGVFKEDAIAASIFPNSNIKRRYLFLEHNLSRLDHFRLFINILKLNN